MAALAGTEALKRLTDMSLGACVQLGVVVCTKWISVTLIQKSPCHEDVLLLRRGVNVFTDLQSTCDFVFWYLFYLNAPIKNMSYDLCTPQAFLGFKTFSETKNSVHVTGVETHKNSASNINPAEWRSGLRAC